MGVHIIEGHEPGSDRTMAVLFCSTSGIAFGPVFDDADDASRFLEWLDEIQKVPRDPRSLGNTELMAYYEHYLKAHHHGEG